MSNSHLESGVQRCIEVATGRHEVVMNDVDLRRSIIDELEFEPSLSAANIGVGVADGVVTLTGYVWSYMEKLRAERAVKRVKGVRGLAEELEVRHAREDGISDDEIARRAVSSIDWDPSIPADKVQVRVENGWITLSGKVDWHFQKVSAESAVRRLVGAKGVINRLAIEPHVQPKNVKSRIEKALKRKAGVEASKIKVTVSGSKVILDGDVSAWFERNAAENVAWAVPGVAAVEDRLNISRLGELRE